MRLFAFWLLLAAILCPLQAAADEAKTFVVLPFAVKAPSQYAYLEQAIPSMLTSRLTWKDHLEPSAQSAAKAKDIDPAATAGQNTPAELGTDYLVAGSATIIGRNCDLALQVLGADKPFELSRQTTLDDLIPALEEVAQTISQSLFERPAEKIEQKNDKPQRIQKMNPEFVYNETGNQEYFMNPQFRYEGSPDSPGRWRSQTLPFSGVGMSVADLDGDGQTEVAVISDNVLHVYQWSPEGLRPLDSLQHSLREQFLNIRVLDQNRDGLAEIFVSSIMEGSLRSFVAHFDQGKLKIVEDKLNLYFNVARTPPNFISTLVAQKRGFRDVFAGGVHEVLRMNGKYQLGGRINLPSEGNVFNFAFLPQKKQEEYKVVIADKRDHLRVYTHTLSHQATTSDSYAGSSIGLEMDDTMPGLKKSHEGAAPPQFYYIPTRLIPTDIDQDGRFELIVNKNMSVAAQFFQSYRNFPQGEIRSLYWDGIGLNIHWKTQVIKGSICDYVLGDMNNDGDDELCVLVRLHPGVTGIKSEKSMVLTYTLDSPGAGAEN